METNLLNPKTNSIVDRVIYSKLCDKPIYCEIDDTKYILVSGFLIPYIYCLVYCSVLVSSDISNDLRTVHHNYENSFISNEYREELSKMKLTFDTQKEIISKVKSTLNKVLNDDLCSIFEFMCDIENQRKHYYESAKI